MQVGTYDAGAKGGSKIITKEAFDDGVDCEQGPQIFKAEYLGVEEGQILCIKTRTGDSYAILKVLHIGINGMRLGVLAGTQLGSMASAARLTSRSNSP